MEPSFFLSYWRPWNENSSFVDSWGDYLKNTSLVNYGANKIGEYIKDASREQVAAIRETAAYLGFELSKVSKQLEFLNWRTQLLLEQQRLTNIKLENIAELLKIPDYEKERQQEITLGIQFFINASKNPRLFSDSLEHFLKAESLKRQDYFVLHKIGCILLLSPDNLDPEKAFDYFVRAGEYAEVESDPNALRLINNLSNNVNQEYILDTTSPDRIFSIAADSYRKAALASYIIGNDKNAIAYQEKVLRLQDNSGNPFWIGQRQSSDDLFFMSKYLIRAGEEALSLKVLAHTIDKDPKKMEMTLLDYDLASKKSVLGLITQINDSIGFEVDKRIINSFKKSSKTVDSINDNINYLTVSSLIPVINKPYTVKIQTKHNISKYTTDEIDRKYSAIHDRIWDSNFYTLTEEQRLGLEERISPKLYTSIDAYLNVLDSVTNELISYAPKGCRILFLDEDNKHGLMCTDQPIGYSEFIKKDNHKSMAFVEKQLGVCNSNSGKVNSLQLWDEGAIHLVNECRVGGFDDWFLPSSTELYKIINHFPDIPSHLLPIDSKVVFWSSSFHYWQVSRSTWLPCLVGVEYKANGDQPIDYCHLLYYDKVAYVLPVREF